MNKRSAFVVSAVAGAALCMVILASMPGMAGSKPSSAPVQDGSKAPLNEILCKHNPVSCGGPRYPFAYLLALPVDSPITNESQLFQSIPAVLDVLKFNRVDGVFQRWDGTNCCKTPDLKSNVVSDCHPTGPGGCFAVAPGEGYGVVVTGPGDYNIVGTGGSTVISLLQTTPGISINGQNLVSLPYCFAFTTAKGLMNDIGLASVTTVMKYITSNDTYQTYFGRAPSSSGNDFAIVPGEAYLVKMKTTTSYIPSTIGGCPLSGCGGCAMPCDDGNLCTTDGVCSVGVCVAGSYTNCADNDPLTTDSCNGCTGACLNELNTCSLPPVNGTITLPPVGCSYLSPAEVHFIVNGLPSGTEVHYDVRHGGFTQITPLTSLRGTATTATTETFDSDLVMHVTGTGMLSDIDCALTMGPLHAVIESQPTQPGAAEQDFNTDMKSLTGELTNDTTCSLFKRLKVTAGTDNGMPSPGHVHLHQIPGGSGYDVASFFSVNTKMDFVGKGRLEGMSGSTREIVRMGVPTTVVPGATVVASVAPSAKTLAPGTSHAIAVLLSNVLGEPVIGGHVGFSVSSGPNAGAAGACSTSPTCVTDGAGRVTFSYTSNGAFGTDQIAVCPDGLTCSNVTAEWACINPPNVPTEVDDGLAVVRPNGTTQITWNLALGSSSSDVLRGLLSGLPVGPGGGDEVCLANGLPSATTTLTDNVDPTANAGFWYLVRGGNVCGKGPYGFQSLHEVPTTLRVSTTCP